MPVSVFTLGHFSRRRRGLLACCVGLVLCNCERAPKSSDVRDGSEQGEVRSERAGAADAPITQHPVNQPEGSKPMDVALAQSEPPSMPGKLAEAMRAFAAGKAIDMDEPIQLYAGGMANALMEKCNLPSSASERSDLASFLTSLTAILATGRRYSDPDLTKTLGSQAEAQTLFQLGANSGQDLSCSQAATQRIQSAIARSAVRGRHDAAGGPSTFVQSCSKEFTVEQCNCLVGILQTVNPNAHKGGYSRDSIKGAIASSPYLGFQIGLQCKIVEY